METAGERGRSPLPRTTVGTLRFCASYISVSLWLRVRKTRCKRRLGRKAFGGVDGVGHSRFGNEEVNIFVSKRSGDRFHFVLDGSRLTGRSISEIISASPSLRPLRVKRRRLRQERRSAVMTDVANSDSVERHLRPEHRRSRGDRPTGCWKICGISRYPDLCFVPSKYAIICASCGKWGSRTKRDKTMKNDPMTTIEHEAKEVGRVCADVVR